GAVYTDSLQNSWQSYGWAKLDFANSSPVQSGTKSIRVDAGAFEAMYLHHDAFDTHPFKYLIFWLNGGEAGGQRLKVPAVLATKPHQEYPLPLLKPNTWTRIVVPLSALGADDKPNMDGFWIQNLANAPTPAFYVDTITLAATAP